MPFERIIFFRYILLLYLVFHFQATDQNARVIDKMTFDTGDDSMSMAKDGSFALIYDANGGTMKLDLTGFSKKYVQAQWFNPSDGTYIRGEKFKNKSSSQVISSPDEKDRILVLDAR